MEELFDLPTIAAKSKMSKATIRRLIHQYPHYRRGGNGRIMMTQKQIEYLIAHQSQLYIPK